MRSILCCAVLAFASAPAFALDLEGDYTVPTQNRPQLTPYATFPIFDVEITRDSGDLQMRWQIPRDLMMGNRMEMDWDGHPGTTPGTTKFGGGQNDEGEALCTGLDAALNCNVTFKRQSLNLNRNAIIQNAHKKFAGTSLEAGVRDVGIYFSEEPRGVIKLFAKDSHCPGCSVGNGIWNAAYQAPNGQRVDHKLYLERNRGVYALGNASGLLSNISYNGMTATARWQMNGQSGWVIFRFDDQGSFHGDWGSGNTPGAQRKGWWNGDRD